MATFADIINAVTQMAQQANNQVVQPAQSMQPTQSVQSPQAQPQSNIGPGGVDTNVYSMPQSLSATNESKPTETEGKTDSDNKDKKSDKDKNDRGFRSAIANVESMAPSTLGLNMGNPEEAAMAYMGAAGGYGPRPTGPNGEIIEKTDAARAISQQPREVEGGYNFTNNTPEDKLWSQLTQREQFNQTMFDDNGNLTDFGQAIVDAYGADYGNRDDAYEKWRGSNNRDLTAALFGYGDEGDNQGIRGWQQLAQRSGVNNLDEMMDYMWGDQAFNIYDYLTNDQYANASALGYSDDAMAALASYIASDPEIGMYIPEDIMGANNEQIAKYFNSPDFAEYALANEMAREASANEGKINLSRYDLDRINDILGQAGEGYMLGAVDENSGFEKKESQNPRNYSMPGLLNGRAGLRPYAGSGDTSNLDSDELDTILAALNASDAGKGKEIGIKGR